MTPLLHGAFAFFQGRKCAHFRRDMSRFVHIWNEIYSSMSSLFSVAGVSIQPLSKIIGITMLNSERISLRMPTV